MPLPGSPRSPASCWARDCTGHGGGGDDSVAYWIGELALGVTLVVLAAIRLRSSPGIALMLALSAIASAVFYFVYTRALGALF